MRSTLSFITAILVLSLTFNVLAFEAGEAKVQALEKGQRAPFSGMLFPTEMAVKLGLKVERLEKHLTLDVDREKRFCQAQLEFGERLLQLETNRRDNEIEILRTQIADQQEMLDDPIPWYKTWTFGLVVGVVSSVLLVAASAALAFSFN